MTPQFDMTVDDPEDEIDEFDRVEEDVNPFDTLELLPHEVKSAFKQNPDKNPFDQMEVDETWGKWTVRTLAQIPMGIAQAATFPLDLMLLMGQADIYDEDEIRRLEMIAEREGVEFDVGKYYAAAQEASEMFPTVSNYEEPFEEATGIPVVAKDTTQKLVRLGSSAAKLSPGTASQKAIAGGTAAGVSGVLRSQDVPEEIADLVGLGVGGIAGAKAPKISIGPKTKPSGLPVRKFEKVKKPTTVTPGRAAKIDNKIEGDFRKLSKEIIAESPVGETAASLESNAKFKNKVGDQFKKVQDLAEGLPETFKTTEIKQKMARRYLDKEAKGLSPGEYDVAYKKEMRNHMKKVANKDASATNLVEQFRKNNQELKEFFEPGQSRSFNNAKRDALMDYNKIIEQTIKEKYPNSEFSKLFESTNKDWTKIKGVEFMNEFIDDMLDGKVDFKKAKKFYDKRTNAQFRKALGDDLPKFTQLMDDFVETGRARALIKSADKAGASDFVKTAGLYMVSPKAAAVKHGVGAVKTVYQTLLDKPQIAIKWDRGIKLAKAERFGEAGKIFKEIDAEVARQNTLRLFNEGKGKK